MADSKLVVQAALLLCARVVVLSNGDEKLVRVLLPQILDLALRQQAQPHVLGCAVYAVGSHLCRLCAQQLQVDGRFREGIAL